MNAFQVAAERLKQADLRVTQSRKEILGLFLQHPHALSHSQIDELTGNRFDRVTLYRSLKSFVDHGLIHEVIDDQSTVKYSLCSADCDAKKHADNHAHFKCSRCDQTWCLPSTHIPSLNIPTDYRVDSVAILVTGLCARCRV